jgi:NAD(P)-dependent dehydrogenase (short-subunit alcohol dehydrogenase family)
VSALIGLQGIHVYSAAKGGVIALTRSFAIEHAAERVRVNAICPGTIRTEVWDPILRERPHLMAEYARLYPLGRVGTPEDVANCALFLASDEASFATGAVFTIDGGLTAGNKEFPI